MYGAGILARSWALLIGSSTATQLKLNVTAINAYEGNSVLECWQLDTAFSVSTDPGSAGCAVARLGSLSNISYTVVPSNYDDGLHNAPYKQWVVFTSGLAHISTPDNSSEVFVTGGEFGILFAADTPDVSEKGHRTQFPGTTETVGLQIPTKDGEIPAHSIIHSGPCLADEVAGLRDLASVGFS